MLTDTGELSSKELWLRVAIAAVAMVVVLGVARYVFVTQMQEMAAQIQQAGQAAKQPPAASKE